MIINKTIFNRQDFLFIFKYSGSARRTFTRILGIIFGLLMIAYAILYLYLNLRTLSFDMIDLIFIPLAFLLGIFNLYQVIFSSRVYARKMMKSEGARAERTFSFQPDCVECSLIVAGAETQQKFYYMIMECYYEANDAVYIRMEREKQKVFLILHDDGYTSGSKAELCALLERNGVQKY